jgi:hypothetical protein
VKVVADAVGLGACGNERVERLVEHIRQKGGLALSAFQSMIHRRRLVHHHHNGGRRGAADFCLVTQGSPPNAWPQPRPVTTAICTPATNFTQCDARTAEKRASSNAFPATEFHTIEAIRDFFKARDMPQFCDRGFHK